MSVVRIRILKTIEEGNKQDIEESVSTMKEDIIKSLKNDMDKVVDSRVKELEDRKRRDFNVLLFNMPEAVRNSPEENKASDEESIKRLCTHLGLDNEESRSSSDWANKRQEVADL